MRLVVVEFAGIRNIIESMAVIWLSSNVCLQYHCNRYILITMV